MVILTTETFDEINCRPLYGDIDHHQPKDDNNRPNCPQSYGDSNHQKN